MPGRARSNSPSARPGFPARRSRRRQKVLEEEGYIQGYQAVLDLTRFGLSTTVLVRVTLESQNEDALKSFEAAVIGCPSVVRCFLMSGSDDYIDHRAGARHRGFRAHSPHRTVAVAAGGAHSIQFCDARGRQPRGAAGDLRCTATLRSCRAIAKRAGDLDKENKSRAGSTMRCSGRSIRWALSGPKRRLPIGQAWSTALAI